MIKLVAVDMDGTFLDDQCIITAQFLEKFIIILKKMIFIL